jgi:CheY-like chemotaxis protein
MNPYKNDPIVIIEDDLDDQDILKQICKHLEINNELIFFENGIQALKYLKTTPASTFIILCDINMPMMNGIELRDEINRDERLKRKSIPFIFLSTAATPYEVNKAYKLNVQGFFSKEISFKEFEQEINIIFQYWKRCKTPLVLC